MAHVFLSASALVLSMVKMSTNLLQKQSFVVKGVHEVRAWSPRGPSCGYHHKSWWNMKDGTTFEGSVRYAVGMVPLGLTEVAHAFMTSAWTDSCGNRQDFFSQLMLCLSFCRKLKKSCKMFTWISRKKCAKQREIFRPSWWRMDLYPHGDQLHLGFRLWGQISISNA